ncbi:MAG: 2-C-methyl-D-erythritol 2,4-cyclodiphosphate synthase [Clostridia bacterium]|nr:2-C-methyl-D-erythritol 2,4-cyclodiphosphate synthase [Clostridia bacterium]
MRIGHGIDFHTLVEGRDLVLGGVKIQYEKGLLGHSDADVLLHAICDALLGAAAKKDIGYHFPDSSDEFKGISSLELLKKTGEIIMPYTVCNIDATIIAQKPKLMPFIDNMINNIADALGIPKSCVNVKATTSEGMGFCGRGEGIEACAVCLLN